jgi:nucleoside diphosphate kinase
MPEDSESWTYVLVTPDGLVTESLPWLVEKLRSSGLEPVAGRLIRLESATMLRIYDPSGRLQQSDFPSKRAFDLWYGLGPSCVLTLHYGDLDACDALLAVKGATNPAAASPDSIRYKRPGPRRPGSGRTGPPPPAEPGTTDTEPCVGEVASRSARSAHGIRGRLAWNSGCTRSERHVHLPR